MQKSAFLFSATLLMGILLFSGCSSKRNLTEAPVAVETENIENTGPVPPPGGFDTSQQPPYGNEIDYNQPPAYGAATLDNTFGTSPHVVEIIAGGTINADYLGNGCIGYLSIAPDFRVNWSGLSSELRFKFIADEHGKDATIVINRPDGSWTCNDDESEADVNPGLTIENPEPGQYDIWIGSYAENDQFPGSLYIADPEKFQIQEPEKAFEKNLDYSQDPGIASFRLQNGFVPDPWSISARVGGEVNVDELELGGDCVGYAAVAPDFRLIWSGISESVRIMFRADQQGKDAILIVNLPDGSWVCNDDAGPSTLNPMVILNQPAEGQLDIWVATPGRGDYITGSLIITEKELTP